MTNDSDLLVVESFEEGMRLDQFLKKRFPDYSRTYFQALIDEKLVLVNGEIVKKASKVEVGDEIEVEFAITEEITLNPEPIALDILYEDRYLLAVNKPAGMVVHPAAGNWSHTFVNALLYHCTQLKAQGSLRPGIVHRLDKETSGVLLAAKDELAQRRLVEAFASREIYKEYLAICVGNPGKKEIETLIARHPTKRKEMAVSKERGKLAKTLIETLSYNETLSVVKLLALTGRTHQLRVHMQFIGFPILGDSLYGSSSANKKFKAERQQLHAHVLRLSHPITKEALELKAPLPQDMEKFIQMITKNSI